MNRRLLLSGLLVLGLGPGETTVALAQTGGDPAAGAYKSRLCAGCHGITGWRNAYPAYRVPKLGGQHAEYLVAALKAYQSGQRSHPTMHAVAAGLNEQDMMDLAAFFAGQAKP